MSQESIYVPGETYTSARATPELVGREKELEQIEEAIRDTEHPYIIYITGQGGIGKTRLVNHVLGHPPEDMSLAVASDLIDLYHTRVHSLAGLIGAILEVVEPLADSFKSQLQQAGTDKLEALARAEQEGVSTAEVIGRRKELTDLFLDTLNQFTAETRLVLALDTAERLLVERDPAQQALGLTGERPAILDWLLNDFLPRIRNAVVLLAGRPGPGNLGQALEQISEYSDQWFLSVSLQGLSEEEALEYFEAVIRSAEASGNPMEIQAAEAIEKWSEENRRVIFHCLRDEGDPPTIRPILLALAIDYQAIAGQPLSALCQPLMAATALSTDQRGEIRRELGREMVRMIRTNYRPADEVVTALAWLRKGADADLLSHVAELDKQVVQEALDHIRELSFVKVRPADARVFLHDEMYDILQHYALDTVPEAVRRRVFKSLEKYYSEQIDQVRNEIAGLYKPLDEDALPEIERVIAARARLRDALVEDLHYRLRWGATQGFNAYFRYAEEAIATRDDSLDMQLRAELLGFLSERDPSGQAEEVDDLNRADVTADAAVRWIKRLTNDGRYDEALETARCLRTDAPGLVEGGGGLARAELCAWEALALTYTGSYDEAGRLLDLAEKQLKAVSLHPERVYRWNAISARTYNNLGYLRRVMGQFKGPEMAYAQALPYWKHVKIEAEYANTLNNLAFARALAGDFDSARENVKEALNIRERLGPRVPVAFAYGTWAEIETYAREYQDAEEYARKALDIWRKLGFRRGEGLVLLTSVAIHRFQSENPKLKKQEKKDLLRVSLSESEEALRIFSEEIKEPEREIRVYYERGITYRELARRSEPGREGEKYTENAIRDLERARDMSREDELWWTYLDASMGMAWMYYYSGATEKLDRLLQDLEQDFQQHFGGYRITRGKFYKEKDSIILNRFGRLHVLRGIQAMDCFEQSDKQSPYPPLREGALEFTFALEYNALVSESHQGFQRSMYHVRNRVRGLNIYEQKAFYDAVAEAAEELGLPREECHLWHELGKIFGSYEVLTQLVQQPASIPDIR